MSSPTPEQPALPGDPFEDPATPTGKHPVVVYTFLRVMLLAIVGGVLYLLGLRGVWLLMFAFLISGVLSIFVLNRPREVAAATVVGAVQKVNEKIDTGAAAEDAAVASAAGEAGPTASQDAPPPQPKPAQPRRRDEIPADDDLD